MSILVVGSVALDSIKTPLGEVHEVVGGSATYFAAAASYFCPVRVVAVVGTDFPFNEIAFLKDRGVDFRGLRVREGQTFRWAGEYDQELKERKSLCTELNVFSTFSPTLPPEYRDSEHLFLGNIEPGLQLRVLEQVERPRLKICNTMNFWIEGWRKQLLQTLARVDILIINDSEAIQLSGEHNLQRAGRAIQSLGPGVVVITRGGDGVFVVHKNNSLSIPAHPPERLVDPTGAGDSFCGGFVGYLAQSGDYSQDGLREAALHGAVLASFAIEHFGLEGLKSPMSREIQSRYAHLKAQADTKE